MKIGFIGSGNMAQAMMAGMIDKGIVKSTDIIATDVYKPALEKTKKELNISTTDCNIELVKNVDVIILAVKPQFYESVIKEISGAVNDQQIIVTIAPGKTLEWIKEAFGKDMKIVRTMPNTPAMVGEGMSALCHNELVDEADINCVIEIFESFGKAEVVSEKLMDVVVGVSGSSPAYIYMVIEAMADAAVADGMARDQAYKFAAQAVLGSAKMVLETGIHPGALKDMVCSPEGTTIEAVCVLEEKGLRSAIIEGMRATTKKARTM